MRCKDVRIGLKHYDNASRDIIDSTVSWLPDNSVGLLPALEILNALRSTVIEEAY